MYKSVLLFFISMVMLSCNEENTSENYGKISAKNTQTFTLLNSTWNLKVPIISDDVQNEIANWNEWRQFAQEINQKPKSNLTAFQLKTKNLSVRVDSLQFNMPVEFDKPQVKSRLSALTTKIKLLDTFIHLTDVPQDRIEKVIPQINEEVIALIQQWEEIMIKKQIPKEVGEDFMIKALDTTRNANPALMLDKMNKLDSINNSMRKKKKTAFINNQ